MKMKTKNQNKQTKLVRVGVEYHGQLVELAKNQRPARSLTSMAETLIVQEYLRVHPQPAEPISTKEFLDRQ
jgi:hypothetical protein